MIRDRGFTILEVIIALVVLGAGLLGVAVMQIRAIQGNVFGSRMTEGSDVAEAWMEWMMKQPYERVAALDSNAGDTMATQRILNPETLLSDFQAWGLGTFAADQAPKLAGTGCSMIWRVTANVPEDNMTTVEIETQVAIRQVETTNAAAVNKPVMLRFMMSPFM
jgi:prepilin-type N-terminal cleavage/methylation domain-containing protein